MTNTEPRRRNRRSGYARLFGVGFTFLIIIGLLTAGGFVADRLLGTLPLLLLVGVLAGFTVGLYYVYVALKSLEGR